MRWIMNGLISGVCCLTVAGSVLQAQEPRESQTPVAGAPQGDRPAGDRPRGERPAGDRGPDDRGLGDRRPGGGGPGGLGGGPGGPGGGRMMTGRMPIMAALDADGNGEISANEIEGAVAALKKLDKNGDGKLTADELMPRGFPGGPGGPVDPTETVNRLMAADTNKDGFIDKTEAPERLLQQGFAFVDANRDDKLSKAEVVKFATELGRRLGYEPRWDAPRSGSEEGARPRRPESE